jgi:hypothetical protein
MSLGGQVGGCVLVFGGWLFSLVSHSCDPVNCPLLSKVTSTM